MLELNGCWSDGVGCCQVRGKLHVFVGDMDTYCKQLSLALLCCCPCSALALLTAVRLRADLNNAVYFFEEMLKEKNAPTDECGLCTAVAACMSSA